MASLAAGRSPQGHEGWWNWVVRRHDTGEVIGYVQATVERSGDDGSADLAWVIGTGELDANGEAILRIGPSAS